MRQQCSPQGNNVYLRAGCGLSKIILTLFLLLFVYLRAILHEDEHLLPMDLHPKVVDQMGVVDRFKDSQLVCHIPDDQNIVMMFVISFSNPEW